MSSIHSLLVLVLLPLVAAHICMWSPSQRDGWAVDDPGNPLCYHKNGPCGTDTISVRTQLTANSYFSVEFQQNLNHFYVKSPGYFQVQIAQGLHPQESDFNMTFGYSIPDWNAMNEISMTNYSITSLVPDMTCQYCVMRLVYVSHNPLESDNGTIFYQCADISIVEQAVDNKDDASEQAAAEKMLFPKLPSHFDSSFNPSCCAPTQFASYSQSTGDSNSPSQSAIYYDSVHQLIRYDIASGNQQGDDYHNGVFQLYNNWTSGIEWRYDVLSGKCTPYGLDYWNDWCYGDNELETFDSQITIAENVVNVFRNGEGSLNDFYFGATADSCVPVIQYRNTGAMSVYYNSTVGPIDLSVFIPPSSCQLHTLYQLTQHDGSAMELIKTEVAKLPKSTMAYKRDAQHL